MKIIKTKNKLYKIINKEKKIGFVPTMGGIHLGHLSLIKKSIKECNKTVISIFINKPQFNKKSDYHNYPRSLKKDLKSLKKFKSLIIYIPKSNQIYTKEKNKNIILPAFAKTLCGKHRPGHFKAVVDVIDRFIKIINPSRIYFGEKDMQQLKIVENYVKNKYKKIKIVHCKTVREVNGIAYSTRNYLLKKSEKEIASKIYTLIKKNKKNILNQKISLKIIKKDIINFGVKKIDYLKIIDLNKVIKPFKKIRKNKIFIAYYLRKVRLIDNI